MTDNFDRMSYLTNFFDQTSYSATERPIDQKSHATNCRIVEMFSTNCRAPGEMLASSCFSWKVRVSLHRKGGEAQLPPLMLLAGTSQPRWRTFFFSANFDSYSYFSQVQYSIFHLILLYRNSLLTKLL